MVDCLQLEVYNVDVYNMGVFKYESVYIGLPAMFHSVSPDGHGNTDGFHLIKVGVDIFC